MLILEIQCHIPSLTHVVQMSISTSFTLPGWRFSLQQGTLGEKNIAL